jgi:hypothetical protein
MTLFGRTSGYYLFWTGAVYLISGITLSLSEYREYTTFMAPVWIAVLALPFIIPPFGRWLNMDITWDKNMFNLFGKKYKTDSNVLKFPQLTQPVPPMPEVTPPKEEKEEPAKIYYRLGLTDNNRVAFSMGYSEITMNAAGCQQMIDQLKFYQSQLTDDDNNGGPDPDGGLPLPEEEQDRKAA